MILLNPRLSFKKKNMNCVLYINHNMFFFKDKAAKYFDYVLLGLIESVPKSFILYLKEIEILIEE